MSKFKGRDFLLQIETDTPGTYATIAHLKTNNLTINNAQVDVTDKTGAPWRELLEGAGITSMSMKGNGITSDDATFGQLLGIAMANTLHKYKITSGAGHSFTGTFQLTSFDESGDYAKEDAFTFSLESSGTVTYTAAP